MQLTDLANLAYDKKNESLVAMFIADVPELRKLESFQVQHKEYRNICKYIIKKLQKYKLN
jgi:hypothetical protein